MEKCPKTKANWDSFALKVFCEICKEEVSAGNKPSTYLSTIGYKNLQRKFFARTGRNYERKQFKNRWDSLRKEYENWVTFTQDATGQRWGSTLGTVDADDEWWAKHIEAHPECVKFSNGPPENLANLAAMFDKAHVEVATSAIPGEHIEDPTCFIDFKDGNDDVETNNSSGKKAKGGEKRRASTFAASPKKKQKEQNNLMVQEFRNVPNIMAGSASVTSFSDVQRGHGIKDVIKLALKSGAKECSDLFFTATKLFMNADYREMFSALETNEGRLDWLERMHEEMKKK